MTSTDLAVPDYASEIERAADPAASVVLQCEQVRALLAHLIEDGDLDRIAELKSQGEAIRVYSLSKQLGHDAQLAAAEIVRRAERGIGIAIRHGQESGSVRSRGDGGGPGSLDREDTRISPTQYFKTPQERVDIYAMTDGVTSEQFDAAITEAKAEGNLSRANVIRKVRKEEEPVTLSRAEARTYVVNPAAQRRAITAASTTLSGVCHGLNQVADIHPDITSEEAGQWVASLSESRTVIERLIKRLKERSNAEA